MADSEEEKSLISQFVSVSGVTEERARFYLESASWNLEVSCRVMVVLFLVDIIAPVSPETVDASVMLFTMTHLFAQF